MSATACGGKGRTEPPPTTNHLDRQGGVNPPPFRREPPPLTDGQHSVMFVSLYSEIANAYTLYLALGCYHAMHVLNFTLNIRPYTEFTYATATRLNGR